MAHTCASLHAVQTRGGGVAEGRQAVAVVVGPVVLWIAGGFGPLEDVQLFGALEDDLLPQVADDLV